MNMYRAGFSFPRFFSLQFIYQTMSFQIQTQLHLSLFFHSPDSKEYLHATAPNRGSPPITTRGRKHKPNLPYNKPSLSLSFYYNNVRQPYLDVSKLAGSSEPLPLLLPERDGLALGECRVKQLLKLLQKQGPLIVLHVR